MSKEDIQIAAFSKIQDPQTGDTVSIFSPNGKNILKSYLKKTLRGGNVSSSMGCFSRYKNPHCCNNDMQCKWMQGPSTGACVSRSVGNIHQSLGLGTPQKCGPNFKELFMQLDDRIKFNKEQVRVLMEKKNRLRQLFRQELDASENMLNSEDSNTLAIQQHALNTDQALQQLFWSETERKYWSIRTRTKLSAKVAQRSWLLEALTTE